MNKVKGQTKVVGKKQRKGKRLSCIALSLQVVACLLLAVPRPVNAQDWSLTGNSGTNPANNFLGTKDNQPLVIKTDGREALRINPTGSIGVGTNRPQNRLHVGSGSSSITPNRVNAVFASNNPDAGIAIAQNRGVNVLLQASGAGGYIGTTSNHPLVLRTNDQDRVGVEANGNVRIGPGSIHSVVSICA